MDRARADAARGDAKAERFANILKIVNGEYQQERAELAVYLLGEDGLTWSGGELHGGDAATTRDWLTSRAFSIAGGSTEIQLNILSKRWLGLPVA
jgi:alkylation response protein AidB-like acyl-CoA dehydrogenase